MRQTPDALMLFAAGFGTRMGALTTDRPKPLIPVAGRALIDHALDLVDAAQVSCKVVNLHYLGEQIASHLASRNDIDFAWERPEILETGGGLRAALPLLGDGPVFTLNSDAIWTGPNPLITLRNAWNDADMDALLLLAPAELAIGHRGAGDFKMGADGRINRANGATGLVYLGAQIINPFGLTDIDQNAFSINLLWDRMIAQGRAFGVVHTGQWCDVGNPAGIVEAEALLRQSDVS